MKILDLSQEDIKKNKEINEKFIIVNNNKIKISCSILNNNFFLDTFNYFPITENYNCFKNLYAWVNEASKYDNFFTNKFYNNLVNKNKNFKNYSNTFILGSSALDNHYQNLLFFLPRIFFIHEKKINLAIHRQSSNKLRKFISEILEIMKIKLNRFIYLDDDFYKFNNSQMPQFFTKANSIKIMRELLLKTNNQKVKYKKIYISRQNAKYRNLINESDIIEKLKPKGFKIIDTNKLSIYEQIEIFSKASTIVSATSSVLANIIFSKKGTEIIEITPKYKFSYEKRLKNRYSDLSQYLGLNYRNIEADPVKTRDNYKEIKKFIPTKVLNESNYYKDLLIEMKLFSSLIKNLSN